MSYLSGLIATNTAAAGTGAAAGAGAGAAGSFKGADVVASSQYDLPVVASCQYGRPDAGST